jgi:hypothetical protein
MFQPFISRNSAKPQLGKIQSETEMERVSDMITFIVSRDRLEETIDRLVHLAKGASNMNLLLSELAVIGQTAAQVLVVWLLLRWIASKPKSVSALAVASQRKRAP